MQRLKILLVALFITMTATTASATDYLTFLTPERGFVEVKTTDGLVNNPSYYYLLAPDEDHNLVVGLGRYEAKPGWALEESKAMRYVVAGEQQMLLPTNYFTLEKSGTYIGFRNVVYCADLMQTHDNAGFMYVNTVTRTTAFGKPEQSMEYILYNPKK